MQETSREADQAVTRVLDGLSMVRLTHVLQESEFTPDYSLGRQLRMIAMMIENAHTLHQLGKPVQVAMPLMNSFHDRATSEQQIFIEEAKARINGNASGGN